MNETEVRKHAEGHAQAMAQGDMARAALDLTEEARAKAPGVMKSVPREIDGAEVTTVAQAGALWIAHIVYRGEGRATTVASSWEDRDGKVMIIDLEVL